MIEQMLPALTTLGVTAMLCGTCLHAWRGWLDVRRLELSRGADDLDEDIGLRIELAGVKERLKKLEAIASGVEL